MALTFNCNGYWLRQIAPKMVFKWLNLVYNHNQHVSKFGILQKPIYAAWSEKHTQYYNKVFSSPILTLNIKHKFIDYTLPIIVSKQTAISYFVEHTIEGDSLKSSYSSMYAS